MKPFGAHPAFATAFIVAGVTVAAVLTRLHRGSERGATCRATLIPAYLPPHELNALVGVAWRSRIVIVNPDSGPGARRSPAYARAVHGLQAAGVRVLGYVPTGYGGRPLQAALADVDRWVSWYRVDGIFFDEAASDAALVDYYRALARVVRDDPGRGRVVLNPGVPPAPEYFDLADVVVTFEGTASAYADAMRATPGWLRREPRDRVAHLVYGATRADALDVLSGAAAGYVYATSGALPNPWRTLPDYLGEEVEALARCG